MENHSKCTISGAVLHLPDLTPGEELHLIKKVTTEQDVTQLSKALGTQVWVGKIIWERL